MGLGGWGGEGVRPSLHCLILSGLLSTDPNMYDIFYKLYKYCRYIVHIVEYIILCVSHIKPRFMI